MSIALRFREHEGFQRAAVQMALAGAAAGALAWGLVRPVWSAGAVALVAAAAAVAALAPRELKRPVQVVWRAGLALLGAACLALQDGVGGAAGFALLFGAAISWGLRGRRLALAVAASAGIAGLALFAQERILAAQELASLPGWTLAGLAGLGFSLVSVFALLPRHVELERDEIQETYESVVNTTRGEVHDLVVRAHGVWTRAATELEEGDPNRELLGQAVLRLYHSARRWSSIEAESAQDQAAALVDRMTALDERIASARDDVVRKQYESARAALAEQLRYLEDIGTHRDRVLARMHNYLAVMERLRLAVVKLESADASREGLEPLVSELEELGQDIGREITPRAETLVPFAL